MFKNIVVQKWFIWGGRYQYYPVHLPEEFTFYCDDVEQMRHCIDWRVLNHCRGPCANEYGRNNFFSTRSRAYSFLEDSGRFAVQIRENEGGGSWEEAVYRILPTDQKNSWKARLFLVGSGHLLEGRAWGLNRFVPIKLEGEELTVDILSFDTGAPHTVRKAFGIHWQPVEVVR